MPAIQKTNDGLNLERDGGSGKQSVKITYFAIGSGSAAPTAGDHTLQNEVFRKPVTSYTNGNTGEITYTCVLGNSDAVGANIQEAAWFGGNASSTRNSGVMIARGLFAHNPKLASESITFTLDTTFS